MPTYFKVEGDIPKLITTCSLPPIAPSEIPKSEWKNKSRIIFNTIINISVPINDATSGDKKLIILGQTLYSVSTLISGRFALLPNILKFIE